MIIEKVNNLTEKSFKNYTGPNPQFKQKNIIFGYNGRGKSSLASGIIQEFLKESSNTNDNFRFFNRSFINRNLDLKESSSPKIKGVIANFGEKDVDIEKRIVELSSQIVDTTSLKNEIKSLNKSIRTEIDRIHDLKKGGINIQKKSSTKSVGEVIRLYLEDLDNAKKIEDKEDILRNIKGDFSLQRKKLKMERTSIPELTFFEEEELKVVENIFNEIFEDVKVPSSLVVQWIEQGINIHEKGSKCWFCGNEINLDKIKFDLEQYNRNEKQKKSKLLNEIYIKIKLFNYQIMELLKNKDNITENFECENAVNRIEESKDAIIEFENFVENKLSHMENKIKYDFEFLKNAFNIIFDSFMEIQSVKAGKILQIDLMISNLSQLIKGSIGLEIINNTFINENMKIVGEKTKEMEKILKKNQENQLQIEELKKSKSNTKDFAVHITNVLKDLEINLKIDLSGDNYIIKHATTNQILKLEDISEGEQNLLSLLYFYYELYEDKDQKKFKNSIKLLVVDDPIASMDDINRMYVLELVKKMCDINNAQIFIFTHVWGDFCDICYNKEDKDNTPYRLLEIKKDSNGSKIVSAPKNESPYKHNFKEIYEFSRKSDASDLTDCEIYHYPNIMRKILEEFLQFKVKNSLPTNGNITNVKLGLCGENPSNNDLMRLGTLLNVCNILSHTSSRNPDEILKSAKFLMKKIEQRDKIHFDTMKS